MLDNLVTPIVAVAIILGITFPIWLLVLTVRLVHHVGHIAHELERFNDAYFGGGEAQVLHEAGRFTVDLPSR